MRLFALLLAIPSFVFAGQGDTISLGDDLFRLQQSSGLMVGTTIEARAHIMPGSNNGSDIGRANLRFGTIYVSTLNATASVLPPGSTEYIQSRNTLQSDSIFYVSSASVDGQAWLARTSGQVVIGQGVDSMPPVRLLNLVDQAPFLMFKDTSQLQPSSYTIFTGGSIGDHRSLCIIDETTSITRLVIEGAS